MSNSENVLKGEVSSLRYGCPPLSNGNRRMFYPEVKYGNIEGIKDFRLESDAFKGTYLHLSIYQPSIDINVGRYHIYTDNEKNVHIFDKDRNIDITREIHINNIVVEEGSLTINTLG